MISKLLFILAFVVMIAIGTVLDSEASQPSNYDELKKTDIYRINRLSSICVSSCEQRGGIWYFVYYGLKVDLLKDISKPYICRCIDEI